MSKKDDFSWEKGKITTGNTLGKIVTIPVQDDADVPEKTKLSVEGQQDIVIDEFKEKMAEVLSKELHKK